MRSFLQRTAGATFTCGASLTLAFRKDYVEYIFKLQRGYAVINLIPGTDEQLLLADWGIFFRRITNHQDPQKLMDMLGKPCPKVVDLMTAASGYSLTRRTRDNCLGVSCSVPLKLSSMVSLVGNSQIVEAADGMLDYCLALCEEIHDRCPFPGWKKGLEEVWQ